MDTPHSIFDTLMPVLWVGLLASGFFWTIYGEAVEKWHWKHGRASRRLGPNGDVLVTKEKVESDPYEEFWQTPWFVGWALSFITSALILYQFTWFLRLKDELATLLVAVLAAMLWIARTLIKFAVLQVVDKWL